MLMLTAEGFGAKSTTEVDAILAALRRGERRNLFGVAPAGPAPPFPNPDPAWGPQFVFIPVFYPGTTASSDATPLTVGANDEFTGTDFIVAPVKSTPIEGVVMLDNGEPVLGVPLRLDRRGPTLPSGMTMFSVKGETSDKDGHFTIRGAAPGLYVLTAQKRITSTSADGTEASSTFFGRAEFQLGDDPANVQLRLRREVELNGRIVFGPMSPAGQPPAASTAVISLVPRALATMQTGSQSRSINVDVDGTGMFHIPEVPPGTYDFQATVRDNPGWRLQSATMNGADVLDAPLVIDAAPLAQAVLTFTNHHTVLAGSLQSPTGTPPPEYSVLIFPADRGLWRPQSRRVRATRPAMDGAFTVDDLPAGDYLVAALTDVEPSEWDDSVFLAQLAPGAVRVHLSDGERQSVTIRIAGGRR
jgi:hypothetical protein